MEKAGETANVTFYVINTNVYVTLLNKKWKTFSGTVIEVVKLFIIRMIRRQLFAYYHIKFPKEFIDGFSIQFGKFQRVDKAWKRFAGFPAGDDSTAFYL